MANTGKSIHKQMSSRTPRRQILLVNFSYMAEDNFLSHLTFFMWKKTTRAESSNLRVLILPTVSGMILSETSQENWNDERSSLTQGSKHLRESTLIILQLFPWSRGVKSYTLYHRLLYTESPAFFICSSSCGYENWRQANFMPEELSMMGCVSHIKYKFTFRHSRERNCWHRM